jgi:hypothetical protein
MTGKPQLGAFISSPAVFQEVLVGYGFERYLALIGRRLDHRMENSYFLG